MQILTGTENIGSLAGGVVSIGNFDGVHLGHRAMLKELTELARELRVPAIAMTFDPPPMALISPQHVPPLLTTVQRKSELMELLDIDGLIVYPTHREFLNLSPAHFFQSIIVNQLQARGLVEGENFGFGKNRAGNSQLLAEYCQQQNLEFRTVRPVKAGQEVISSTGIRNLIRQGELEKAVQWLGGPYRLTGKVIPGAQRGRLLGFPTANLSEVKTLIPPEGVYAGQCERHGQKIAAAVHIGRNLTFADVNLKIEVHLIDYQEDLYDQILSVDLLSRCRSVQQFDSGESLRTQLNLDINQIRQQVTSGWKP